MGNPRVLESYDVVAGEVKFYTFSGDSTDTKPTEGVSDGSIFMESNTGYVYRFNEKTGTWIKY